MKAARFVTVGVCLAALVACSATDDTGPRPSLVNTGLFTDLGAKKGRPDTQKDGALALSVENSAATSMTMSDAAGETQVAANGSGGASFKRMQFVGAEDEGGGGGDVPVRGAGYKLNFENADVREVVQAVLGETLKQNYTMTEDVSGKVTISSPRAMTGQELLSALESSLNASGFAMTKSGGAYRIAPTAVGGGVVDSPFATQPSYGVSVVPLRHVSAQTMGKLVSGFITENDGLRVDMARNAMVVRGPGAKRQEAVDAIMSFDADWMQNQAVGIYEVRRATPDAVVTELNRVFDADMRQGSAGQVIQFKPIGRLRAVMVVSKNPALLKRAETWVRRLDRDTSAGSENVFVYKARYRDAKELARIVSTLFRAGGDGASLASSTSRSGTGTSGTGTSGTGTSDSSQSNSAFGQSGSNSGSSSAFPSSGFGQSASGGARSSQSQSAFNNPNFDGSQQDGQSQTDTTQGSGDSLDLTSQAAGQKSNILVSADPANNAVVTYADGYTYQKVLAALRQLDSAPLQVAIHATIAEVTLKDNMKQGVEYFVRSGAVGLGKDNGSLRLFNTAGKALSNSLGGFSVLLGSNSSPDVVISALDEVTDVEVLSSPSLVVAENQPANFQVGDEVPIQTQSASSLAGGVNPGNLSVLNSVEYRDTGVILNVTPRIGTNDAVTMQIEQEISAVSGASNDNTLTPTISKRRVKSNISVMSGQTVLLAGLISKRDSRTKSGIPILGDLPAVGGLFSTRAHSKDRTELVVFIRPIVMRNGEDARTVADEFRSRLLVNGAGGGGVRPAGYTK